MRVSRQSLRIENILKEEKMTKRLRLEFSIRLFSYELSKIYPETRPKQMRGLKKVLTKRLSTPFQAWRVFYFNDISGIISEFFQGIKIVILSRS